MTDAGVVADDAAVDLSRRKFLTVATSATAAIGAVVAATPFVASWKPSERARAMGQPPDTLRLEWQRFKERWTK